MGVTTTALEERETFVNEDARPSTYQVIKRMEPPALGTPEREPLAYTARELAETAPPTRNVERLARAVLRTSLEPKVPILSEQRTRLVVKKVEATLTPAEQVQLDWLTWQLDQYEEAMLGDNWELIQAAIAQQAAFAQDLSEFIHDLKEVRPTAFRSRK